MPSQIGAGPQSQSIVGMPLADTLILTISAPASYAVLRISQIGCINWPDSHRRELHSLDIADAVSLSIASPDRMYAFDGTRPHETAAYNGKIEERFSIVYFLNNRGWHAPSATTAQLVELGFQPASSADEAAEFAERFESVSRGKHFTHWRLQDA